MARSKKRLNHITDTMLRDEITQLEEKRDLLAQLVDLVEQLEPLQWEVLRLRDALEDKGVTKARLIETLKPAAPVERLLRARVLAPSEDDVPPTDHSASQHYDA